MSERQEEQIDALIREIAQKHGVVVGRDDPILVLQTINSRLLRDSAQAQREMLDSLRQELEAAAGRWSGDAREKAEKVVNAALAAAREAAAKMMEQGARTGDAAFRAALDDLRAEAAHRVDELRRLAVFNVAASCITLLAAAIVIWSGAR